MLLVAVILPGAADAQDRAADYLHWAYASFFGTGWYKISDEQDAFIFRAEPRWSVGHASLDDAGTREVEYTLRVPVTIGLARLDFDDIGGILDSENFTTASVGFKFDADIPITDRLSLRPISEIGYATILDDSRHAVTWRAALKSRYSFEASKFDWALIAEAGTVGDDPGHGRSNDFAYLWLGAEFGHPTRWSGRKGAPLKFFWHLAYVDFIDEVVVRAGDEELDSVANYWQIAASFGREGEPIQIWRLKFDRLGLGYNYSSTGRLRGIKIIFRSLYDL